MFGSTILDVAIGLIFFYLLLSLVCSAVKELIEGFLRQRASDLETALQTLVGQPLKTNLYGNGLIKGLTTGGNPAYIPAQTFALALMDVVAGPGARGTDNALPNPTAPPAAPQPSLRLGATAQLPALVALIDAAGADAAKVRENIEAWYNAAMDRVTGNYKRRTQTMIAVIGAVIVCSINADSIKIVRALSNDAALRSSLVAAAQEYAKGQTQPAPAQTPPAQTPLAQSSPAQTPAKSAEAAQPPAKSPAQQLQEVSQQIGALGLPLGWQGIPSPLEPKALILKFFGLLLTAAAISFGAPFWFDLLNKVINVRAAIKPDANKTK